MLVPPAARAVLLSLLLLLGSLAVAGGASAGTTLDFEFSNASANEAHAMRAFDAPSVATADFDGDGHLELVAHNDNQYVYVISSRSSRVLAEFRTPYPAGWNVRPINEPAVDDLDGDGKLEIVVVNSAAVVCSYEYGGGSTSMTFNKRWCTRMTKYDGSTVGADAGAAVADVNGDGRKEVFTQTEKKGLFAFNHDGSIRWSKDRFGGNSAPLVTDLNHDGKKEAVFFSDGGTVTSVDASTGSTKWTFWTGSKGVKPGSISITGNAGDLDGDGKKELAFIARHAVHSGSLEEYRKNHFGLFVLRSDGALRWWKQPDWGNPLSYTHPIFHDLNGDGRRDILAMDWNTIGHKPGDWERLGLANVFAYKHDGTLLWRTQLDDTWSNDDLGLADVDDDGAYEVLGIGWGPEGDGVWYLDAKTGKKERHVPVGNWIALRGPVVADFDDDGDVDWAIPLHKSSKGGAFRFYSTTSPCKIAFGGWEVDDPCRRGATASSSGDDDPEPVPPPADGAFEASFSNARGNEWWIEVNVNANEPLAGVDARVDGGDWVALEKKSWGSWARSIHADSGSDVQFRARSTDGDVVLSSVHPDWPPG